MRWWVTLVACGVLGFYTIPTMLYFFGAVALWLLVSALRGDTQESASRFILKLACWCVAAAGLVILLYLPVFLPEGVKVVTSNA